MNQGQSDFSAAGRRFLGGWMDGWMSRIVDSLAVESRWRFVFQ